MEEDKKAAELQAAKEKAQELEDNRNAIKLTPGESLEIVKRVQDMTRIEPTGDADADKALKEAALETALAYRKQEKKAMNKLRRSADELKDELGEEAPEYLDAKAEYYRQKAIFEQIKTILASTNSASTQAAAALDKARFSRALDEYEIAEYREVIEGFKNWAATGDPSEDRKAGNTLLAKLEDDAQFELDMAKRKMDKKDNDKNKQKYYDALSRYEFLSKELGDDSPAKIIAKARKVKAAAEAALQDLAASLGKAKDLNDVVKFIEKASKGTSPLPALLKDARTNDVVADVLHIVSEDPKMAKLLATELLAATSEDAAASAFANVAQAFVTQGTDDPEVIMRAKLDALVSKYVVGGELAMSKIKDRFNKASEAAQTLGDLDAALMFAA